MCTPAGARCGRCSGLRRSDSPAPESSAARPDWPTALLHLGGAPSGGRAARVSRLDRGPPPGPPGCACPEGGRVRETERAARYSPFDHAICVEPRRLIIARRGAVFLSADLKQCELRVAAHLSGDARLRRCFEERGDDPFVELVERCAVVKDRAAAKQLVYAVLFGQSTRKAARALNVDARAAVDAVQRVRALFPALDAYRATVTAACREHGFVETVLGRRRRLPDIHSTDPKRRRKAERLAGRMASQPDDERDRTIVVRSLAYEADEGDVRKLFRHIPDVVIKLERGSATVVLPSKNDVTRALACDLEEVKGRKVRVRRAED